MKNKQIGWICLNLLLWAAVAGCTPATPTPKLPAATATPNLTNPTFEEYGALLVLPNIVGAQWTYAISIGDVDPIKYAQIVWPMNNGQATLQTNKDHFPGLGKAQEPSGGYELTMKVIGKPARQGPFEYIHAVELEIARDDLGVYAGAKQVFWLVPSGPFEGLEVYDGLGHGLTDLSEVVTYPASSAPVDSVIEDGFSIRYILIHGYPGISEQIYTLGGSQDEMYHSLHATKKFPGYEGQWVFHYQRSIAQSSSASRVTVPDGFIEDTWYAAGVGLIRLEQRVRDVVSMTWTLESYSIPAP